MSGSDVVDHSAITPLALVEGVAVGADRVADEHQPDLVHQGLAAAVTPGLRQRREHLL